MALLDRVFATAEPLVLREQVVRLDKENGAWDELWVDAVYQPLVDTAGRVTGIMQHVVDVTDQVQARQALAASEAKYRALFASMDQGFCVVEVLVEAAGRPTTGSSRRIPRSNSRPGSLARWAARRASWCRDSRTSGWRRTGAWRSPASPRASR